MIHGFDQFNRGEYWHQHETIEAVWRSEPDESIRNLYKGILQVGVGFYHITRRNYRGAIKVLGRGIGYLRPYAPSCMGVDVQRLIEESSRVLENVQNLGPERIEQVEIATFPQVHYSID
jgi:predicted metal-dependent hydrolase